MYKVILVLLAAFHVFDELDLKFKQNDYKVQLERAEVVKYNKQQVREIKVTPFKCNRTTVAINFTIVPNVDIGYNAEVVIQGFRFASNEYRIFPLRFQVNVCKAISADAGGLQRIYRCGNFTRCFFPKGIRTHICNWTIDSSKMPPHVPSGSYKAEVQCLINGVEAFVMNGYAKIFRDVV